MVINLSGEKDEILTIELGGGDGVKQVLLHSKEEAQVPGKLIYDRFLDGNDSSVKRPVGTAVLDVIRFDIEQNTSEHYDEFIQVVHNSAVTSIAFDAIFIQFYNTTAVSTTDPPTLPRARTTTEYDWTQSHAVNKNMKLCIGTVSSPQFGAGDADISTLQKIVQETRTEYPSTFGSVMLWDAHVAVQ